SDASMVVLMREGNRTVLTMQVDYRGPTEDFAMIVPVPEVLDEDQVRTLPHGIFSRLDRVTAPRLAEYWEQNPCPEANPGRRGVLRPRAGASAADQAFAPEAEPAVGFVEGPPPVVVEREFSVDEYEIVVLSASDSTGLLDWLDTHDYALPPDAETVLRPYIAQGTKFFLAKVDASRVRFQNGEARLSPLQFDFESPQFVLPIRLGLLNSGGTQDLVVHTLTRWGRTEAANYQNATVPTNLRLEEAARTDFASFYAGLIEQTIHADPRTVVTEFAGEVDDLDRMDVDDLRTLGSDRLASRNPRGFTMTRLHYRYTKDTIGDDIVFRRAPPIGGGDERIAPDGSFGLRSAQPRQRNSFQARFAILHPFEGAARCRNPRFGRWGHRPGTARPPVLSDGSATPMPRERLSSLVHGGLGSLAGQSGKPPQVSAPAAAVPAAPTPVTGAAAPGAPAPAPTSGGLCSVNPGGSPIGPWLAAFALLGCALLFRRRRSPGAPRARREGLRR
ncbi:MAG: DUF2330 domain-containing protein, partial [Myxococcota bacterium]